MKTSKKMFLKNVLLFCINAVLLGVIILMIVVTILWVAEGRMSPWGLLGVIPVTSVIWALMVFVKDLIER